MSVYGNRQYVCKRLISAIWGSVVERRMWSFAVFDNICECGYEGLEDAGSMLGIGE